MVYMLSAVFVVNSIYMLVSRELLPTTQIIQSKGLTPSPLNLDCIKLERIIIQRLASRKLYMIRKQSKTFSPEICQKSYFVRFVKST